MNKLTGKGNCVRTSRRQFLAVGGAAVLASGIPVGSAPAQSGTKYTRMSLSDPGAAGAIQSYKNAVAAMLKLPPTDPRNWYRNAFIHIMDCPHGNWWLLPWHRGYIGWFEQTCRELSGDSNFALPYWDWTAQPGIPAPFADDSVLNPSNPAYVDGLASFQQQFTQPVSDFYASLNPDQLKELSIRGMSTPNDFWNQATSAFFPSAQSRQPDFSDPSLLAAISIDTIQSAIAPSDFIDFGSAKAEAHSEGVGSGILEAQPHNNVHTTGVGGFMSDMLSPIDPIFFMHHSNLDRLWDVWTRKQQKMGLPTLPTGDDLTAWSKEPFLFYANAAGHPVGPAKAGDYATIGDFNYTYQPGSGEQFVPTEATRAIPYALRTFTGTLTRNVIDFQEPTIGSVNIPEAVQRAVFAKGGPRLVARITLQPPENHRGIRFHVLLNPPEGARNVGFRDPSFGGTITLFGSHSHGHMAKSVSFDVPLTETVKKLRAAGLWKAGEPLRIQVVPDTHGITAKSFSVPVKSITVRAS